MERSLRVSWETCSTLHYREELLDWQYPGSGQEQFQNPCIFQRKSWQRLVCSFSVSVIEWMSLSDKARTKTYPCWNPSKKGCGLAETESQKSAGPESYPGCRPRYMWEELFGDGRRARDAFNNSWWTYIPCPLAVCCCSLCTHFGSKNASGRLHKMWIENDL